MTKPLAPEVVPPGSFRIYPTIALAVASGLVGISLLAAGMTSAPKPPVVVEVCHAMPQPLVARPAPIAPVVQASPRSSATPDPRAGEVHLVFTAGKTTYMKLATIAGPDAANEDVDTRAAQHADDGEPMPKHGKAKLVGGNENDWTHAAVATVELIDLPLAYRVWNDREVLVDGACRAKVAGFAVVARLDGETSYSGVESESWTTKTVLENGARQLVAKLAPVAAADGKAKPCEGTLARDASLAPIVVPWTSKDPALVAKAKALLVNSELGQKAAQSWKDAEARGTWTDPVTDEGGGATFSSQILHHPTTGKTFVSVRASVPFSCGGADVNVWGLYEVGPDGALAKLAERPLAITDIDQIVDIDNDGTFELIGSPLFDERAIEKTDGTIVEKLEKPFFGCPC